MFVCFFIADLQRKLITFECPPEVIDAIVATLCKVWCMYISCFRPMSNAQISVCFWLLSNEWQLVATLRPWNSWAPLWLWNSLASPIRAILVLKNKKIKNSSSKTVSRNFQSEEDVSILLMLPREFFSGWMPLSCSFCNLFCDFFFQKNSFYFSITIDVCEGWCFL